MCCCRPSKPTRANAPSPANPSRHQIHTRADRRAPERKAASEMKTEETPVAGGRGLAGGRPCDTCAVDAARLYCRTDGAYLCAGCDTRAHGAESGSGSRHARVWLCEVCDHAPAAVTCRADAAALCAACDVDIHSANPLASRHERIPVAPFFLGAALSDAPATLQQQQQQHPAGATREEEEAEDDDDGSNEAEAASWLLPEPGDSADAAFFGDSDAYLGLDLDFVRSMDEIKAIGVPVAPSELDIAASSLFYPELSMNHSVSSSEAAVVPDALSSGGAPAPSSVGVVASKGKEREARLMRYREKRKNRRFHKTIRYASRKAYAETRPRIKGRFAKRTADDDDALEQHDGPFSSAAALLASHGDYGVVPSF